MAKPRTYETYRRLSVKVTLRYADDDEAEATAVLDRLASKMGEIPALVHSWVPAKWRDRAEIAVWVS